MVVSAAAFWLRFYGSITFIQSEWFFCDYRSCSIECCIPILSQQFTIKSENSGRNRNRSLWTKRRKQVLSNLILIPKQQFHLHLTAVRGYLVRRKYRPELEARQKAVPLIQAQIRGYLQRKRYKQYKSEAEASAIKIQKGMVYFILKVFVKLRSLLLGYQSCHYFCKAPTESCRPRVRMVQFFWERKKAEPSVDSSWQFSRWLALINSFGPCIYTKKTAHDSW